MKYVAVSCGYDTWFAVRLVMDYTTSHFAWSILGYLLWIPPDQVSPSQTHRCPGACGSRQKGHVVIIGTFHILPTGIHGLCFGSCFQVRSLYVPCYMVHFQGSILGSP